MTDHPHAQLVSCKRWADRGLYDVIGQNLDRLGSEDAAILLRILDHIHVVDRILLQKNGVAPNDDRMTDFLEIRAA